MGHRAEVVALRDGWERNEISPCELWACVNTGHTTKREALRWIDTQYNMLYNRYSKYNIWRANEG